MALYVKLINLKENKGLNGTLAEILDYHEKRDRFVVKLCNGSKAKVKIENILDIGENVSITSTSTLGIPGVFNIGKAPPKSNKYNKYGKKRKKRKKRKKSKIKKQENKCDLEECSICMDVMRGEVKLKCGHKMCPECFAQHSRKNNTCPFCRDDFAPKIQEKSRLSEQLADIMVREVVEEYFDKDEEDELDDKIKELLRLYTETPKQNVRINMAKADIKATVYAHMTETARIMYEDVEEWYDENE